MSVESARSYIRNALHCLEEPHFGNAANQLCAALDELGEAPSYYLRLKSDRNLSEEETAVQIERVWKEFWEPIFVRAGAQHFSYDAAFLAQVKLELYDMHNLMSMVSKAYCDITMGRVSKPLTDPRVVAELAEQNYREWAIRDAIEYIEVLRREMLAETESSVDYGIIKLQVGSWDQIIDGMRETFLDETTVDSDAEEE